MANLCDYTMHVIGTLSALDKFTEMMDWKTSPAIAGSKYCADLDVSDATIPLGPDGGILKNDEGEQLFAKTYYSATRWSVLCGMIDVKNDDDAISIQSAAKQLGLDIEIYSEEEGNQFAEYVTINPDGGYNVDCVDYAVMYFDDVLDELGSDASESEIKDYIAEAAKDLGGSIDIDKAYAYLKAEESLPIGGFEGYHPFPLTKEE